MFGDIFKTIAGPIIGGLFGSEASEDAASVARDNSAAAAAASRANTAEQIAFAREQMARNEALQREFATHGVTWRVGDARSAGVHPVYALGGAGAAFAPNPIVMPSGSHVGEQKVSESGWMADMGQNLARALMAVETPGQAQVREANVKMMEAAAARDLAQAQYYSSQAAQLGQAQRSTGGFPSDIHSYVQGPEYVQAPPDFVGPPDLRAFYDTRQVKADEQTAVRSTSPHITAGTHAGLKEFVFGGGFRMLLPNSQDLGEALEALAESPTMLAFVLEQNSKQYGPGWYREAGKQIPGLKQLIELGEEVGAALPLMNDPKYRNEGHREQSWLDRARERYRAMRPRSTRKWPY